jgi:3-oxoacyl-[acyl-carrier protein] reductase
MNNIIFITGASSDIGVALIKSIKEECVIIAHYNSNEKRLLDLQEHTENKIVPIQADFSSNQSLIEMLDKMKSEIGIPNKIIHLAAPKFENIRFKNTNWVDFQKELCLSLGSITQILNRLLPKMVTKKGGRVITILSSVTIGVPPKALTQYTTVKYALLGLMKALASEYANKKITFNCISPSMVETQFLSNIDERIVQLTAESHPLKRNAIVEDIIPVILMLLSDDSAYLNGLNIPITGGNNF